MHTKSVIGPEARAGPVGQNEVAEGLMLIRASTLKLIRLQLALERRDRRVALKAVDDLVELDWSLQERLAGMRAGNEHLIMDLAIERAALNREKLTLAAEIISNESNGPSPAEPSSPQPERQVDEPSLTASNEVAVENATEAPFPAEEWAEAFAESHRPRRIFRWALVLVILLAAAAGAALVFDIRAAPEWPGAARAELRLG